MPVLMRTLPQVLHMLENQIFLLLLFTALPVYSTMFHLFHQIQRCHHFQYFEIYIEILWKKIIGFQLFHMHGIDNDPDPDPA
jgi:hypothetical protein